MDNLLIGDFEGPLDLLLHLIKKKKMEIFDIEISVITKEYIDYIKKMEDLNLDIASEYLVMAFELIEIKSKKLVPGVKSEEENSEDIINEDELKNRLYEYQKYKENIDKFKILEEKRSNYFTKSPSSLKDFSNYTLTNDGSTNVEDLVDAFKKLLLRVNNNKPINTKITRKEISVKERINVIRNMFKVRRNFKFTELFDSFDKPYVVVTFLSVLEMAKDKELIIKQDNNFSDIYLERAN